MKEREKLLLPVVAGQRLGKSDRQVRRLCQKGIIRGERTPGKRDLRIPESEVEAYRQEHE